LVVESLSVESFLDIESLAVAESFLGGVVGSLVVESFLDIVVVGSLAESLVVLGVQMGQTVHRGGQLLLEGEWDLQPQRDR